MEKIEQHRKGRDISMWWSDQREIDPHQCDYQKSLVTRISLRLLASRTTLDKINPIGRWIYIYDTRGLFIATRWLIADGNLKYVSPKIKPKTYQLNPEQTLSLVA